ncbi:MAG: LLM class flavin-dependent oxidoreductase [Acidimicrobiia bacterium]
MRIGIKFDLRNPAPWSRPQREVYDKCLTWCEEADARGVGSIWVSEHHLFTDGYIPQPLTFAAAIAARTKRARIGTAVLLAPLRPPILIAEEAAVVDIISGGRLDLGMGAGYARREFAAYEADFASRFSATDAAAIEIRQMWKEGSVTPSPLQDELPIYLGYTSPKGAYRAGKNGFALLHVRPALVEAYFEGLRDGGHSRDRASLAGDAHMMLTDDPERTYELVKRQIAWRYDTYNAHSAIGSGRPAPPLVDPDMWAPGAQGQDLSAPGVAPAEYHIVTPEEAVRRIKEIASSGFPIADLHTYCTSGVPDELVERHIELVCDHLIPALASKPSADEPAPTSPRANG